MYSYVRSSHGQGLVEAAGTLVFVTALIIGGVLVILGAGTAAYYKIKLAQAAESGARYATETAFWLGAPRPGYSGAKLTSDVIDVVNTNLTQMRLPAADRIEVSPAIVNGKTLITVTVAMNNIRLLAANNIAPAIAINLTETSSSAFGNTAPLGWVGIGFRDPGSTAVKSIYLPCYGASDPAIGPVNFPPQGRYPYWQGPIIMYFDLQGPRQNHSSGGPFVSY